MFGTGGQYINRIIESYLGKTLTKIIYFFMSVYFFYFMFSKLWAEQKF
jgi:hypothetical protein